MLRFVYSDTHIISGMKSLDIRIQDRCMKYLYKKYWEMTLKIVRNNEGNYEDAKDVFQEAMIVLYKSIRSGKFRGESSIKTYLYRISNNIWLGKLRAMKPVWNIKETEGIFQKPEGDDQDTALLVKSLIERIGEKCRNLLLLYYWEECSMKEISEIMSFSNEDSAKTQKYKCMGKLIELIDSIPSLKERLQTR